MRPLHLTPQYLQPQRIIRKSPSARRELAFSLLCDWKDIVSKFLLANDEKKKGNIEPMKVWTNTEMGETWEEEGTELENDELKKAVKPGISTKDLDRLCETVIRDYGCKPSFLHLSYF